MYVNNFCLEEYLSRLSTYHRYVEGGKNNLVIECIDGNVYEVYYTEGTTEEGAEAKIPVPSNRRFTISGDNMKGFIVTVLVQEGEK
jgi:D-alanyl-D-alanine carboxypeptidase